jgi:RNA polymerase sigma-70 factor, ECF subfamily
MERQREQRLVSAAQQGDAQAFTELYHAYVDVVYRHIFYRTMVAEVAEDLTADVFMRVYEGLPSYQQRDLPFMMWVYRIARARLVDYYRRGRQRFPHENVDTLQIGVEHTLDDSITATQQAEQVQQALQHLTDHQQQVIILRFIEGHDLATTAKILDISVGAVKAAQFKAVQKLSQLLNEPVGIIGQDV